MICAPPALQASLEVRIVPSPSARIVRKNVDNLRASGATGFTGRAHRTLAQREDRSHVNVDNLRASGATGFTGQERIVPSPSARIVRM